MRSCHNIFSDAARRMHSVLKVEQNKLQRTTLTKVDELKPILHEKSAVNAVFEGQTDEHLVELVVKGDRSAYQCLVERHGSRVRAIAFEILRNREDAEDVAQESFVKAFLSIKSFKGESSFYTWLYRIVYNMAIDLRRKYKRRGGEHLEFDEMVSVKSPSDANGRGGSLDGTSSRIEGPHEALHWKEAGSTIRAALADLSEEHRAVIVLREVDGLNYDDIARITGAPRGTIMSRLHYARKSLQKALSDFAPYPNAAVSVLEKEHEK